MNPLTSSITRQMVSADECDFLQEEFRKGKAGPPGTIIRRGTYETFVDENKRRASTLVVSAEARALVERILMDRAAELSQAYDLQFNAIEAPQFICYRKGEFFRAHQDCFERPGEPDRLLTTVLFLNSQNTLPVTNDYCGGELVVHRGGGVWETIKGQKGLLVVFPSATVHEVRPVTHGERCAVVGWYLGHSR